MSVFVPSNYQAQYREMLANRAREDAKLEGELARLRAGSIPSSGEVVTAGPVAPVAPAPMPSAPAYPVAGLAWNVGSAETLPMEGDFSQIYGQEKTQPRADRGDETNVGGESGQQKRRTKKRRSKKIQTRKKARSPSGKKRSRAKKKTPRKKAARKK